MNYKPIASNSCMHDVWTFSCPKSSVARLAPSPRICPCRGRREHAERRSSGAYRDTSLIETLAEDFFLTRAAPAPPPSLRAAHPSHLSRSIFESVTAVRRLRSYLTTSIFLIPLFSSCNFRFPAVDVICDRRLRRPSFCRPSKQRSKSRFLKWYLRLRYTPCYELPYDSFVFPIAPARPE